MNLMSLSSKSQVNKRSSKHINTQILQMERQNDILDETCDSIGDSGGG